MVSWVARFYFLGVFSLYFSQKCGIFSFFMKMLSIHDQDLKDLLYNGGVGVLPTDTVYGLVCRALHLEAVARLYALKHREKKPGTILVANTEQVAALGITQEDIQTAERFWPGISVILPANEKSMHLHQGLGTLAVRLIEPGDLADVIKKTGPLLSSSANMPGEPPASTIAEAQAYFGDTVDFYVDGGDLSDRQSSTLIRVKEGVVEVLRQGSVSFPAPSSSRT